MACSRTPQASSAVRLPENRKSFGTFCRFSEPAHQTTASHTIKEERPSATGKLRSSHRPVTRCCFIAGSQLTDSQRVAVCRTSRLFRLDLSTRSSCLQTTSPGRLSSGRLRPRGQGAARMEQVRHRAAAGDDMTFDRDGSSSPCSPPLRHRSASAAGRT